MAHHVEQLQGSYRQAWVVQRFEARQHGCEHVDCGAHPVVCVEGGEAPVVQLQRQGVAALGEAWGGPR